MPLILQKGAEGEEVKRVQRWLNKHGYNAGKEDGIFGDKTRAAVIQFQSAQSILINDIVILKHKL